MKKTPREIRAWHQDEWAHAVKEGPKRIPVLNVLNAEFLPLIFLLFFLVGVVCLVDDIHKIHFLSLDPSADRAASSVARSMSRIGGIGLAHAR